MAVVVLGSLAYTECAHGARCLPSSVTTLLWTGDGMWEIGTRDGELLQADLAPNGGIRPAVYVHPALVVLNFRTGGRFGKAVVLLPDMVDSEAFRRLRVRLRFEGMKGVADGDSGVPT